MPKYEECSMYDTVCRANACTHGALKLTKGFTHTLDVITANRIPFRVVYGIRNDIHGKPISKYGPVVSFYDRRYPEMSNPDGQFVSDYVPNTILDFDPDCALNLMGNVAAWSIDRATMLIIRTWLYALV